MVVCAVIYLPVRIYYKSSNLFDLAMLTPVSRHDDDRAAVAAAGLPAAL